MAKRDHKTVHVTVAALLGIVAIVHAARLLYGLPLVLGDWQAPMWLSWLAFFITGGLAIWLWKTK